MCNQLFVDTAIRTAATAVPAERGVKIQRQATDESIWATRVGEGGVGLEIINNYVIKIIMSLVSTSFLRTLKIHQNTVLLGHKQTFAFIILTSE